MIRRLAPGDETILSLLAWEDGDFDLDNRCGPAQPLSNEQAQAYLANPAVLHWVAVERETVVGFLYCLTVPLRSGVGQELLLYEIGVRKAWRRRGVGRALLDYMQQWMQANCVQDVWVLADNPGAVEFYRACDFGVEDDQPIYMTQGQS